MFLRTPFMPASPLAHYNFLLDNLDSLDIQRVKRDSVWTKNQGTWTNLGPIWSRKDGLTQGGGLNRQAGSPRIEAGVPVAPGSRPS